MPRTEPGWDLLPAKGGALPLSYGPIKGNIGLLEHKNILLLNLSDCLLPVNVGYSDLQWLSRAAVSNLLEF